MQTVLANCFTLDRLMNSGVMSAPMTVAPTHGSTLSFLAALYATMIGRK